jgi:hypothetical protein
MQIQKKVARFIRSILFLLPFSMVYSGAAFPDLPGNQPHSQPSGTVYRAVERLIQRMANGEEQ